MIDGSEIDENWSFEIHSEIEEPDHSHLKLEFDDVKMK